METVKQIIMLLGLALFMGIFAVITATPLLITIYLITKLTQ